MTTNTDVAMPELLPCPFCGHAEPSFERTGTGRHSCIVDCGNCGARHESSDEYERSGKSWNTRAAIQQAAVPEGLADLLLSCRGSVKADLERYEVLILGCNYNETIAVLEVEANRLRVLLDSIDALDVSSAPTKQQPALGRGEVGGVPLTYAQKRHLLASLDGSVAMGWLGDDEADELKALLIPAPHPSAPTSQINPEEADHG